MNPQEFIKMCEDAIEKVIEQKYPSTNDKRKCLYLSDKGCCVVGHMMPNDEVRKRADELLNSNVRSVVYEGVWGLNLNNAQISTLGELQINHDFEGKCGCDELHPIDVERFRCRCSYTLNKYKDTLK